MPPHVDKSIVTPEAWVSPKVSARRTNRDAALEIDLDVRLMVLRVEHFVDHSLVDHVRRDGLGRLLRRDAVQRDGRTEQRQSERRARPIRHGCPLARHDVGHGATRKRSGDARRRARRVHQNGGRSRHWNNFDTRASSLRTVQICSPIESAPGGPQAPLICKRLVNACS